MDLNKEPAVQEDNERGGGGDFSLDQAKVANEFEHNQSVWQAVTTNSWGIFWSLMISTCVIMEGYDTILLGNFYAYPQFAKKFGTFIPSANEYQLSAAWQAGLSNASGVGAFFGALLNGVLVDRFGQKPVVLSSLFTLNAFLFIVFFAPNTQTLLVGEILCGFPWGVFATTAPAYASEVLPLSLRPFLTSWTNMCFIIGQLIAAGVLAGLVHVENENSYRIPFALQWFWPAFLIPILFFAPESPWYLVRKGRLDEARHSLTRLQSTQGVSVDETLALIVLTNKQEQEQLHVETTYWQCFQGTELRRTEIACMTFAGQIFSGLIFAYNSTYFFQQVGLSTKQTYDLNVGGNALALLGTIISWILVMPRFGRRTIYIWGMFTMAVLLFVIGILNVWTEKKSVGLSQAVLTLVWTFVFQLSVGQLGWALPAEVGSTRLRQKTVVLARDAYYIASVIASVLQPYFMNPTAWNLKGYTGFVWGGTSFITCIWAYYRLPETAGRNFDELNLLFSKGISARHFDEYEVSPFEGQGSEKATVVHVE
jgi:SP family general alpha glucoside:H+ symporter-like MFS transporter